MDPGLLKEGGCCYGLCINSIKWDVIHVDIAVPDTIFDD